MGLILLLVILLLLFGGGGYYTYPRYAWGGSVLYVLAMVVIVVLFLQLLGAM